MVWIFNHPIRGENRVEDFLLGNDGFSLLLDIGL
jgi:hypothetical protein